MTILIAVPCFNEEEKISKTINAIRLHTNELDAHILVVNDGSTDSTEQILQQLNVRVVTHSKNLGLGVAFKSAVEYSLVHGYSCMVTIDADGQFDESQIKMLATTLQNQNYDLVSGSRFLAESIVLNMPKIRKFGNLIYSQMINRIAGLRISDVSCGFRAYSRNALHHLNLSGKFTYTHESILVLAQQGLRISEIPIKVRYYEQRKSSISGNLFLYALKTVIIIFRNYFFFSPSRVFFQLGNISALIGGIFAYMFFSNKISTGTFQGYYFAGVCTILLGGIGIILYTAAAISLVYSRINRNQNQILALMKKLHFDERTQQ